MAKFQLLLPKMGESVAEATIIKWTKNPGDFIEADETVMEIATDKVDSEVPSPVSGKLAEQLCKENDVVQVGAVIAIIETVDAGETKTPEAEPPVAEVKEEIPEEPVAPERSAPETVQEEPVAEKPIVNGNGAHVVETSSAFEDIPGITQLPKTEQPAAKEPITKDSIRFYSPLVRSIAAQENIGAAELDQIPGSGAEGRLTKDDLLNYLQSKGSAPAVSEPQIQVQQTAPTSVGASAATSVQEPGKQETQPKAEPIKPAISSTGGDEIIEMDRMRRLIADHMVMSKQTSPHVTSFVEADVTGLVQWRERVKNSFEKREGEKITFTPIFIEAVVKAIRDFPMINVSVNGTQIIKKKDINISMATALPSGNLIVPVIKKAEELNLVGLTKAVNDLAGRARSGKLLPDDVKDGTFTITNVGSFGNVMGTPIINQPQVAILAVGAIKKKPAVIETKLGDVIGIRHMMFLSLSYDHRVVDGALGGSFVRRVADYLENWDLDRDV